MDMGWVRPPDPSDHRGPGKDGSDSQGDFSRKFDSGGGVLSAFLSITGMFRIRGWDADRTLPGISLWTKVPEDAEPKWPMCSGRNGTEASTGAGDKSDISFIPRRHLWRTRRTPKL